MSPAWLKGPGMYDELSGQARQALSDYLSRQSWSYWFTATSAKKLRYPRQAIGLVLDSISGSDKGFVGAERHYLGGWHAHGLLEYPRNDISIHHSPETSEIISAKRYLEIQLSRRGFCRVESIKNPEAVATYISKYITKDLNSDWEIWGVDAWC